MDNIFLYHRDLLQHKYQTSKAIDLLDSLGFMKNENEFYWKGHLFMNYESLHQSRYICNPVNYCASLPTEKVLKTKLMANSLLSQHLWGWKIWQNSLY